VSNIFWSESNFARYYEWQLVMEIVSAFAAKGYLGCAMFASNANYRRKIIHQASSIARAP
jgi:hypothetical protein